ncbi:hypothetical protein LDENG_00167920, partial [Lucifuga dentata]
MYKCRHLDGVSVNDNCKGIFPDVLAIFLCDLLEKLVQMENFQFSRCEPSAKLLHITARPIRRLLSHRQFLFTKTSTVNISLS